jgi:hypothetical protein
MSSDDGDLNPGEAREATSAAAAVRAARALEGQHEGVVAFSRSGGPTTGEFENAAGLARFGQVDLDELSA